ncbi:MAG: hypothetical protein ACOC80_15550 [Petrotogales bacterium]
MTDIVERNTLNTSRVIDIEDIFENVEVELKLAGLIVDNLLNLNFATRDNCFIG